MMVREFFLKEKVGWWATKVVLLIKAVVCVRSEPATLGPIPQGALNRCGGREQHSSFPLMLLILIYLQPGAHPPLAARVQRCSKGKKSISVGECACSLQKLFLNMTEFILNLLYLFLKNTNTMAAVDVRTVYFCATRLPQALLPASVCQTQKWQIIHYSSSSLRCGYKILWGAAVMTLGWRLDLYLGICLWCVFYCCLPGSDMNTI